MLLPWGKTTVLGQVIETLQHAGIDQIVAVTGGARTQVEIMVTKYEVLVVHNNNYEDGEMLSSLQCGMQVLVDAIDATSLSSNAALICLGDQPQIQEGIITLIVDRFLKSGASLVVPSYRMRRGHPWLVSSAHWNEILKMSTPDTPRDFLNHHSSDISYINVDDSSIVSDLDTSEDYLRSRP